MIRWLRPFVFPALLLAALEIWARTVGAGSDAVAPPSAALRAFAAALVDGSLLAATGFTLASAAPMTQYGRRCHSFSRSMPNPARISQL